MFFLIFSLFLAHEQDTCKLFYHKFLWYQVWVKRLHNFYYFKFHTFDWSANLVLFSWNNFDALLFAVLIICYIFLLFILNASLSQSQLFFLSCLTELSVFKFWIWYNYFFWVCTASLCEWFKIISSSKKHLKIFI